MTQQTGGTRPILVSDFDGTMTARDFYRVAQECLVPAGTPDYWEEYLAGRITHFEALRRIFTHIRGDEAQVLATTEAMGLDPTLPAAIHALEAAGWEIVIASAGCRWYIDYLLRRAGIAVTLHANPGSYDPARGVRMEPPLDSPFYHPGTGIDKEAVVRDALARSACVAFAGDGRPDLPAALLVPPARRFARGWLAETLAEDDIPFQHFAHWSAIATHLLGGGGRC